MTRARVSGAGSAVGRLGGSEAAGGEGREVAGPATRGPHTTSPRSPPTRPEPVRTPRLFCPRPRRSGRPNTRMEPLVRASLALRALSRRGHGLVIACVLASYVVTG